MPKCGRFLQPFVAPTFQYRAQDMLRFVEETQDRNQFGSYSKPTSPSFRHPVLRFSDTESDRKDGDDLLGSRS